MTYATGLKAALRTLFIVFVAALGSILGTEFASAADDIGVGIATIHTYDTSVYDEPFGRNGSERGPPTRAQAIGADAVDHGRQGASSRPSVEASWAYTAYTLPAKHAQVAGAMGAAPKPAGAIGGVSRRRSVGVLAQSSKTGHSG